MRALRSSRLRQTRAREHCASYRLWSGAGRLHHHTHPVHVRLSLRASISGSTESHLTPMPRSVRTTRERAGQTAHLSVEATPCLEFAVPTPSPFCTRNSAPNISTSSAKVSRVHLSSFRQLASVQLVQYNVSRCSLECFGIPGTRTSTAENGSLRRANDRLQRSDSGPLFWLWISVGA